MRMVESVGESPFSKDAARDLAVCGAFGLAAELGYELNWLGAHEMSGRFQSDLEGWIYQHTVRVPIAPEGGV